MNLQTVELEVSDSNQQMATRVVSPYPGGFRSPAREDEACSPFPH